MLDTTQAIIRQAGKKLGLDESAIEDILKTNQEHVFDIKLNSGKSFKAYRVQHNNDRGPYKGGIRFHPTVNLKEVRALAILMSLKTALIGLPLGGGKGGVVVNPRELNRAELEELSRKYVQHLQPHIGPDKDIPAPDVNTDPSIIDWMVDEYANITSDKSGASFTGKSLSKGGSEGRDAATGRGGLIVLQELLKQTALGDSTLTYAVQGFGNVGSFFSILAEQQQLSWKLVAASDSGAAIYNTDGLSAKALTDYKKQGKNFKDYSSKKTQILTNDDLIKLKVDVLVLAALSDSVNKSNASEVKAKYVLELANSPVSYEALPDLDEKGVTVIPDILANAGGVIVSYLEWLQNKAGTHWSEDKVNQELYKYLVMAVEAIRKIGDEYHVPLKEAAIMRGIKAIKPIV